MKQTFLAMAVLTVGLLAFSPRKASAQEVETMPLRLAVAGVTHGHLGEVTRRIGNGCFEIVGVWEADDTYRERNILRGKVADDLFYADLGRMLDQTKPEVVVAYGSIFDHEKVVEACAPRGIDVMVEKPLATTVKAANRMAAQARKYGTKVLTNYETSWYASNHEVKRMVDAGALGKLTRIQVYDGHQGPVEINCGKEFLEWLTDPVGNGGGAITDFGCYGANLATWLLGGRKPLSVYAVLTTHKPQTYPMVDDDATVLVDYGDLTVQIMPSWCWPYGRKDMYVYGLDGYLWQKDGNHVQYFDGQKATESKAPALQSPYDDSFQYLRAVVRGDISLTPADLASLENNLIVVQILEAARKSAKSGKAVRIK